MIHHYIKVALRNLLKNKGQTLISAFGLAMGILAFTICSYLVRSTFAMNSEFPRYDQMALLTIGFSDGGGSAGCSPELADRINNAKIPGIEAIALTGGNKENLIYNFETPNEKELPFTMNRMNCNQEFLDFYSIQLIEGSRSALFGQPGSVILSETNAKKIYGNDSPLGKTIQEGETIYTIRGIMKDIPIPNYISGFTPVDILHCITSDYSSSVGYYVAYLLLAPGSSAETINELMKNAGLSYMGKGEYDNDVECTPNISYLKDNPKGIGNWREAMLPIGAGFLVLLTGLINFLSFSIGSFYNRTRELSLRKSIGATPGKLFGLLFTELALIILLATGISLCLSEVIVPPLMLALSTMLTGAKDLISINMYSLFIHQFQYLAGILTGCAVIAWLAIVRLRKMPAMQGIRGGNTKGNKHRLRNVMLGVQFFICLFFTGAAVIMYVQNRHMKKNLFHTFPAEEQKRTYEVPLSFPQLEGIESEAVRQLSSSGLTEDVLITGEHSFPLNKGYDYTLESKINLSVTVLNAGPNLTSFIHLPIVQGKQSEEPFTILINKELNRLLDKEEKSGTLLLGNKSYTISGVVENTNLFISKYESSYFAFLPVTVPQNCYLKCKPGQEKKLKKHIDKVMRQWIPKTLPLTIRTFDQVAGAEALTGLILIQRIISILALISLSITILGIYAAITLDTKRRQKEVAIRKINGATFCVIILLFGKLYISIFILTSAFVIPLLWSIANVILAHFNIRYNFNNPLFWFGLLLIVACVITVTIAYKLYKISKINPAEVIKAE